MNGLLSFILGILLFFLLNIFIFRVGFSTKADANVSINAKLFFVLTNIVFLLLVILARLLL